MDGMALGGGTADVHPCNRGPELQRSGGFWILHAGLSRIHGCHATVPEGNDSYTLYPLYCRWYLLAGLCTDYLSLVPRVLAADGVVLTRQSYGWR